MKIQYFALDEGKRLSREWQEKHPAKPESE